MVTSLDKALKRQIAVNGAHFIVTLDADGFKVTGKGKRKPDVQLRWSDLLSGDAAMAVALNASLLDSRQLDPPELKTPQRRAARTSRRKAAPGD